MGVLEGQTESVAGAFNMQEFVNTLWAYARMGLEPGSGLMVVLEGRSKAVAGTFKEQELANTLWVYARIGREPGALLFITQDLIQSCGGGGGEDSHHLPSTPRQL